MQPGARLEAAISILHEIMERRRGASVTLADWGRSNRFAGSADRAWIGNLVYDALRRKQSLAYLMQSESPRAIALAALHHSSGVSFQEIRALCSGERFSPQPLTAEEETNIENADLTEGAPWIKGNYPDWLQASFSKAFGEEGAKEGDALSSRAPVDLRVNTLKATREKLLKAFARHSPIETPYSPLGVRLPAREGGARTPNVEADPAHGRGWFEVQDEGSQIAALVAGAEARMQVADICAGAGGKTLAMSAQMQNTGQIYAYNSDPIRFRPIFERLKRAGARNVQTLPPGQQAALEALSEKMDLVLIDAPCSGSGVWRRRPDAKWRLTTQQLSARVAVQQELLGKAAGLVKAGGTIAYVTCSVLPEENEDQAEAFLAKHPEFSVADAFERAGKFLSCPLRPQPQRMGLQLTPAQHGTDGFYIALLRKNSAS